MNEISLDLARVLDLFMGIINPQAGQGMKQVGPGAVTTALHVDDVDPLLMGRHAVTTALHVDDVLTPY